MQFIKNMLNWASTHPKQVFFGALSLWWLGGSLAILVPVAKWQKGRQAYYGVYGRYIEYEQAQRQYEQGQNQQNEQANYMYDQYGNYVGQDGQYDAEGNLDPNYGYKSCYWFQYKCKQQQYQWRMYQMQNGNSGDRNTVFTPQWYQFLGGKEGGDSRDRQERGQSAASQDGGSKFVYGWTVAMFVGLLMYGSAIMYSQYAKRKTVPQLLLHYVALALMLVLFFHAALMQMILIPQGVISTENRELEESVYGWYGQWGVLLVYWEFAQCLFTGIALLIMGTVMFCVSKYGKSTDEEAGKSTMEQDDANAAMGYGRFL